jgi:hypothetical protein
MVFLMTIFSEIFCNLLHRSSIHCIFLGKRRGKKKEPRPQEVTTSSALIWTGFRGLNGCDWLSGRSSPGRSNSGREASPTLQNVEGERAVARERNSTETGGGVGHLQDCAVPIIQQARLWSCRCPFALPESLPTERRTDSNRNICTWVAEYPLNLRWLMALQQQMSVRTIQNGN